MKAYEEVTAEVTYIDEVEKWGGRFTEWKIELAYNGKQLECSYYTGISITEEPDVRSTLEALFADAATIEVADNFEDWCEDLGYDSDSITALNTYNDCVKYFVTLHELLGESYSKIRDEVQEWS